MDVDSNTRLAQPRDTDQPTAPTLDGESSTAEYARIEQVAARTGLTKRTLRYYEEIGLLAPPSRTEGGYRLYSEDDVQRLMRIKRLRDLMGFSLSEIREYVSIEEQRAQVREAWARDTDPHARLAWLDRSDELLSDQLRLVEEKLAGLQDLAANLRERMESHVSRRAELRAAAEERESSRP